MQWEAGGVIIILERREGRGWKIFAAEMRKVVIFFGSSFSVGVVTCGTLCLWRCQLEKNQRRGGLL